MTELAARLHAEIRAGGPISFARFMERALYEPGLGYYQRARPIGRRGDFYTSVSVGPLFGRLLAWQFARWTASFDAMTLVEAGAHDGQLAADVLEALAQSPRGRTDRLDYVILEPSPARRARQVARLSGAWPQVRWIADWAELGEGVRGVIFGNELLDAFPLHRLAWDAARKAWGEWLVDSDGAAFAWARRAPGGEPGVTPPAVPEALAELLPDGFTFEVAPGAEAWWRAAAAALRAGVLLSFDYGAEETDLLAPARAAGTARAYRAHQRRDDLLADPGEQDLTAQVNFTRLRAAGEAAGLRTVADESQGRFLGALVAAALREDPARGQRLVSQPRAWATLTHPEHLGAVFRVLAQERVEGG